MYGILIQSAFPYMQLQSTLVSLSLYLSVFTLRVV
jgi:hypothetical protein